MIKFFVFIFFHLCHACTCMGLPSRADRGEMGRGGGELVYVLTHTNHCIVFDFHSNMSIPLKHKTYSTVFLAQKSVMCK